MRVVGQGNREIIDVHTSFELDMGEDGSFNNTFVRLITLDDGTLIQSKTNENDVTRWTELSPKMPRILDLPGEVSSGA